MFTSDDDVPEGNGDDTAVGDTPQAHDEINPHDLPPDHPGREAAEDQAGGTEGTTQGHDDPVDASPET